MPVQLIAETVKSQSSSSRTEAPLRVKPGSAPRLRNLLVDVGQDLLPQVGQVVVFGALVKAVPVNKTRAVIRDADLLGPTDPEVKDFLRLADSPKSVAALEQVVADGWTDRLTYLFYLSLGNSGDQVGHFSSVFSLSREIARDDKDGGGIDVIVINRLGSTLLSGFGDECDMDPSALGQNIDISEGNRRRFETELSDSTRSATHTLEASLHYLTKAKLQELAVPWATVQ